MDMDSNADSVSTARKPLRTCIVVPCLNEEGVITHTTNVLLGELEKMSAAGLASRDSYICCVDDGSTDGTWEEIEGISRADPRVRGIKLSTNFGHPNALVAGLFSNSRDADILITIDADLQDDVSVLSQMLRHHHEGKRVVYGVRLDRQVDVLPKRVAAEIYYRVLRLLNGRTVRGHADFRSADSRVVSDLERFGEANIYLRGLFPLIGYPSAEVHFVRQHRHAGVSKYPYRKLLSLAWEGVTSFSTTPLRFVFLMGVLTFLLAFGLGVWILWAAFTERPVQGWASLAMLVVAFAGINMVGLGVIGEYVGKIYKEVKRRPRYIIETTTDGT